MKNARPEKTEASALEQREFRESFASFRASASLSASVFIAQLC